MQNEKKTRFEVGMPVIFLNGGYAIEAKVTFLQNKTATNFGKNHPIIIGWHHGVTYHTSSFTNNGFATEDQTSPSLFTLPEYEALQVLTASFIDGTFGAKKEQPKFEPKINEPIIYNGKEYVIKDSVTWHTLQFVNGVSSVKGCHVKPVEGYEYANGFCLQMPKPKADVIGLPSWFKGAMYLDNRNTISYLIGFLIGKEKVLDECLSMFNISLTDCSFVYCFARPIGDAENALCLDFIHNSRYYSLTIDVSSNENTNVLFSVQYNKNGIDTTEKIF